VIERRFRPADSFVRPIVGVTCVLGIGLGVLDDLRSGTDFDVESAVVAALAAVVFIGVPFQFLLRWLGKVVIDGAGVSTRDTWGRWRTYSWESISAVRKLRLLGLPFVLVSSSSSRWSLWLAGRLEPREGLIVALMDAGPRAEALRAQFGIVQRQVF
jgi:hypothetical protein